MDSVYLQGPDHVELDVGTGAAVAIDSSGWEDIVVWNPWTTMEACYQNFVCVENAKFGKPVTLGPGEDWSANATFSVVDVSA
jgi:glucose-6-phosphate 1-epimerase